MKYLLLFTLLLIFKFSYSQDKLEREYRIKQSEVPQKALNYVGSSLENVKIKWYGEENLSGKAIEAKGKREGKLYSIKFDSIGELQDIEMVIKFNSIPENVRTAIEENLKAKYSRLKVQKTQIQWVGNAFDLAKLVQGDSISRAYSTNYEITFRGSKDRRTDYYEVLANVKGELIRVSRIVQSSNQNLIY